MATQSAASGGSAVSGTAGSTAAIGQIALVVSVIAVPAGRIRVVAVHDRLRLGVDLLVEVESESVLARERGEAEDQRRERHRRERDDLERTTGRDRHAAACARPAARGSPLKATPSTRPNTSRSRTVDGASPIPMPAPSRPHVTSGTNQIADSLRPRERERQRGERVVVQPDDRRDHERRSDRQREALVAPDRGEEDDADHQRRPAATVSLAPACTRRPYTL